ncbi:AMP-binding protein [Streptomyces litchfieldiae]|uniref:AMP-binding protein n=1 Tax=Streptomyces litchfieldiae TaxID=3075543 RepID=A0ABU2MNC3_9ACTN|nr:AMP-binding protein [Streptomyces sp. DSM 44938]MDT0343113.1 AMP-binding protein [Streptomyces sp. DSM 44938]
MAGDHGGPGDHGGRYGGFGPADVLSHAQLLREGERAAGALARLGVRAGDPLPVLLPMCLESVVVTLACVRLSVLRVSLTLGTHPRLLRERIRGSGARVVVTADSCQADGRAIGVKAALDRALTGCPEVETVLVVPQLARPVPWHPGRDRWWHEALAAGTLPPRPYPGQMDNDSRPGRPQPDPLRGLVFDDPLERGSSDDSDQGWGEVPPEDPGSADVARFLHEKPPHHL